IYVSPELAAVFIHTSFQQCFADHGALWATFQLPDHLATKWTWPMPSLIRWDEIRKPEYHAETYTPPAFVQLMLIYDNSMAVDFLQPVSAAANNYIVSGKYYMDHGLSRVALAKFNLYRDFSVEPSSDGSNSSDEYKAFSTTSRPITMMPPTNYTESSSPHTLPDFCPSTDLADLIYHDFQANFRALESWNLRQKSKCARAKVQQFQHLAFKSIRDTSKPAIDWLQTSSTATIIAVSEDGNQILTDRDIEVGHLNTCRINEVPALVCGTGPCTYQVDDTDILLVPGQHLQCDRHLTMEDEIHQELTDFWTTRWNTLPTEAWNRFTAFTRAYVPDLMAFMLQISKPCPHLSKQCFWIIFEASKREPPGLHRHFRVRDTVGPPISSNNGYPEGCGMSCLAMVIVYQSIYAPNSIALSYVDNLEQVASNIGDLMTSIITQDSFMELFQLATDHNKTYAWALQARDRSFLQQLRLEVVDQAEDLGGLMTYGRQRRTACHEDLLRQVKPCWSQLQRANSPEPCKQRVIYQALWPKIFHSASISDLGIQHIKQLRTKAVRALGHGRAGAAPALRLLSNRTLLDPGFYQLWHIVQDLKRVLSKTPSTLEHWQHYMEAYDGTLGAGPFSTILQQLHQIAWR
ncbi:unnamed protein product, partial [Effrenium voratum]